VHNADVRCGHATTLNGDRSLIVAQYLSIQPGAEKALRLQSSGRHPAFAYRLTANPCRAKREERLVGCRPGRLAHRRAGTGADRVGLAGEESHRSGPGLLASHFDWHRSGELRVGLYAHHRSNAVCSRARSVGFGPVCVPPHTALTEQLSTTARDQSTSPLRASQLRSAKCIRSQTPSCCQSRRRRQQVIPDPQPSSFGNICTESHCAARRGCP
jgi:hypothetical protein